MDIDLEIEMERHIKVDIVSRIRLHIRSFGNGSFEQLVWMMSQRRGRQACEGVGEREGSNGN